MSKKEKANEPIDYRILDQRRMNGSVLCFAGNTIAASAQLILSQLQSGEFMQYYCYGLLGFHFVVALLVLAFYGGRVPTSFRSIGLAFVMISMWGLLIGGIIVCAVAVSMFFLNIASAATTLSISGVCMIATSHYIENHTL